jgi:DNA-binding response OmpR family regulator
MTKRVLVIDDNPRLLRLIRDYLAGTDLTALCVENCSDGLRLIRESPPDVVLVDAALPDLDGPALCRMIKGEAATRSIPVVIMSGQHIDERHVLAGLRGGADDYVLKPFSLAVLVARLEAVMRRYEPASPVLKRRGVELDPAGRTVTVRGRRVALTRKEFDLLATLLSKPGRVFGVRRLLETVWGYDPSDYTEPATVEVHVHYLRRKLGPALAKRIVTVVGHGYKFEG